MDKKQFMHELWRYKNGSVTRRHFLGDTEPWKREWTTTTRPHDWLFVFSKSSRGRLLYPLKFQVAPAVRSARSFALHALRSEH